MKNLTIIGIILFAFAAVTGAAWANCPAPPSAPPWWKTPDPGVLPDGASRTQFHSFITDPNPPDTEPDCTYNGFIFAGQDAWAFTFQTLFGAPIPGGTGPNIGDDGLGLQVPIDLQFDKLMRNLEILTRYKEYFVAVSWWDALPGTTLNVTCIPEPQAGEPQEPIHVIQNNQLLTVGGENGWRTTFLTGQIVPQPDFEEFIFNFEGTDGRPYIDSIWVGTTCVPEPSTIAMMLFGGLGVASGAIRKIHR